jgi:hypothetical protein
MISEDFYNQLIEEGINPEEIKSFYSKYDKKTDCIVSVITMNDDSIQEISYETGWYASRKDKKW